MLQFAEKEGFQYIKERLSAGGLDAPVSDDDVNRH